METASLRPPRLIKPSSLLFPLLSWRILCVSHSLTASIIYTLSIVKFHPGGRITRRWNIDLDSDVNDLLQTKRISECKPRGRFYAIYLSLCLRPTLPNCPFVAVSLCPPPPPKCICLLPSATTPCI